MPPPDAAARSCWACTPLRLPFDGLPAGSQSLGAAWNALTPCRTAMNCFQLVPSLQNSRWLRCVFPLVPLPSSGASIAPSCNTPCNSDLGTCAHPVGFIGVRPAAALCAYRGIPCAAARHHELLAAFFVSRRFDSSFQAHGDHALIPNCKLAEARQQERKTATRRQGGPSCE